MSISLMRYLSYYPMYKHHSDILRDLQEMMETSYGYGMASEYGQLLIKTFVAMIFSFIIVCFLSNNIDR